MMVVPAPRRLRTTSHASRRAFGSNPVVGSSRNSRSGSPIRPSARSRRRFWPPDRLRTFFRCCPARPTRSITSPTVPRRRVVAGVAGDRLADRQVGLDRDVLQHQPDPLAQRPAVGPVAGIDAEHIDPPGVPGAESLQDLQDGGLAGAVRPEQREDLPAGDGEAHPAHGLHRAIALPQPRHDDRAGGGVPARVAAWAVRSAAAVTCVRTGPPPSCRGSVRPARGRRSPRTRSGRSAWSARAVNDRGATADCSIDRLTGRVTSRTVSVPVRARPSGRSEANVMTGYWLAARRRADRTLASGCGCRCGSSPPRSPHRYPESVQRPGDVDRPGPDREVAANRREPEHVPGPERDGRTAGVDLILPWLRCRLGHRRGARVPGDAGVELAGLVSSHSSLLSVCVSVLRTLGRPGRPGVTRKWTWQVESSAAAPGTKVPPRQLPGVRGRDTCDGEKAVRIRAAADPRHRNRPGLTSRGDDLAAR